MITLYKLRESQKQEKIDFIARYVQAANAATGSEVDSNANVTKKTLATLEAEMYKADTIQINRSMVYRRIIDMFGKDTADQFIADVENHLIYIHDESSLKPYCASITMYPFLLEGTKCLGGVSKAPTNLQSFCGGFVNMVYQVASNFAGAIATVEFLHYFDYFARKQYGPDYMNTHTREIKQELQGVVYALNQPSSARGDQSVFWNISVFDKAYMKEMFSSFFYPDGTQVDLKSTRKLQELFLDWFRLERQKELLTFPVITASMLKTADNKADDPEFQSMLCRQMEAGHSFFVYMSKDVDSLSSCCRLRNELADNTFSYSLGAGGVVTGSSQVITLNMNRLVQMPSDYTSDIVLSEKVQDIHKYLMAYRSIYKDYIDAGLLPAYTAGFMSLDKQFLTIGINGFVEAAAYEGYKPTNNAEYREYAAFMLGIIWKANKKALETYKVRFNTEFVPAENLGVKNARWDKEDDLEVPRDCYNSYFYVVEDPDSTILDKIQLHGKEIVDNLDGGSALHLNLQQLLTYKNAMSLFELCMRYGVNYWTTNIRCTICNECGFIDPVTRTECHHCHSDNVEYGTRIIGYLKRESDFSLARQQEAKRRFYA